MRDSGDDNICTIYESQMFVCKIKNVNNKKWKEMKWTETETETYSHGYTDIARENDAKQKRAIYFSQLVFVLCMNTRMVLQQAIQIGKQWPYNTNNNNITKHWLKVFFLSSLVFFSFFLSFFRQFCARFHSVCAYSSPSRTKKESFEFCVFSFYDAFYINSIEIIIEPKKCA